MTFSEWLKQFDDDKRSSLSGSEYIVANEAWKAGMEEAAKICETLKFVPQGPSAEAKFQRTICARAIREAKDKL